MAMQACEGKVTKRGDSCLYLVAYDELLLGIALILGIFTHVAALMGILKERYSTLRMRW